MTRRLIDAIFDLRNAIINERCRMENLARSADSMGFEKLADRMVSGAYVLEEMVKEVVDAHGAAQSEELRGHEELMGNVLSSLLHRATAENLA